MIYKINWKIALKIIYQLPQINPVPTDLFDFARVDEQEVGSYHVTFQYRENGKWKKMNLLRTLLDDVVEAGGAKWITDSSEQAKALLLGVI